MRKIFPILLAAIIIFLLFTPVYAEDDYQTGSNTFSVSVVSPKETAAGYHENVTLIFDDDMSNMVILENPFLFSQDDNYSGNVSYLRISGGDGRASTLNIISQEIWYSDQMDTFLFLMTIFFIVSGIISAVPGRIQAIPVKRPEPFERYLITAGHFVVAVLLTLTTGSLVAGSYTLFELSGNGFFLFFGLVITLVYISASSLMLSIITIYYGRKGYTCHVHLIVIFISIILFIMCIISGNPGLSGEYLFYIPVLLLLSIALVIVSRYSVSAPNPREGRKEEEKTIYYKEEDDKWKAVTAFPDELSGRYDNISIAGTGGAAIVFRAKRKSDRKIIALKVPISRDEIAGKSFIREISVWKNLKHKNIVEIYSVNIFPSPYIEMEFLDTNLSSLKKPVPPSRTLSVISGIAEGLDYAHSMGIVHHDIKPKNILLDQNGMPKITDWGLSKTAADNFESSNIGFSLVYAAPEQLFPTKYGRPGKKTDIYQTGVLFYELLTGEKPFKGDILEEMLDEGDVFHITPVSEILNDGSMEDFDRIIMKCLKKDPDSRYPDIDSLIEDLNELKKRFDL